MRLRQTLIAVLLAALLFTTIGAGANTTGTKTKKVPCAASLAACPDEGCGKTFDANLNKLKNIRSDDRPATLRTLTWVKKLDDPENFSSGGSREELKALGEGDKIAVVAYVLIARAELGGESCNCGLQTPKDTDNHLVLVTKTTVDKFPLGKTAAANKLVLHSREAESETAEFTPRVRLDHPNFTREKMQPLINATPKKALLARVTGLLLFDSEHFIRFPLNRKNNWEIHPVLKMEFCTTGNNCKATDDIGWKSLDD
jgi:hypothetical protein